MAAREYSIPARSVNPPDAFTDVLYVPSRNSNFMTEFCIYGQRHVMKIPIRVQKDVWYSGQPEGSRSASHFQGELPTMQSVAHLFDSLKEHAVNVAELPDVEIAHDKVGVYDQDA